MPRRSIPPTIAALLALAGAAAASPPPYTLTSVAKSGDLVSGVGAISSAMSFDPGRGNGVPKVGVNNSGQWLLNVHVLQSDTTVDEAILRSATGLIPYVGEGISGSLLLPDTNYVANNFHSVSLNNANNAGLAMGLFPQEFDTSNPTSGVYFNTAALPAFEGTTLTAAGLAPGTVWNRFDADTRVQLNDANQLLIVSTVTESGIPRRVVVINQLDAGGDVTGQTLIAKEGGPVGAGPDTWTSIAGGGHASAINNTGRVAFSGVTAGGTNGVYASGVGFVAIQGGPTPVVGLNWGPLAGAPVDINNHNVVAFRGPTADQANVFSEKSPDAGEDIEAADRTFGNGPLVQINGQLSDDHDVDMYRIRVDDVATFSATTVPDPGSGFAGAAFDTVLTIIASPENGTRARLQCDNVSPTVPQSTVTGATLVSGREYFLCVSTPKSIPQARLWYYSTYQLPPPENNFWFPTRDCWVSDPAGLAIAGGLAYWPDPSAGTIGRSTIAGVSQPSLAAAAVSSHIAVDAAGGKVYWIDRGAGSAAEKIKRANLDGTGVQDLVTATGFGTIAAYDATGLALDTVNGKLYWSRASLGEINRCNLDGTLPERLIQQYPYNGIHIPASEPLSSTFTPESLAVDPIGGKVYWFDSFLDRIERANLDGTGRQTLAVGAGAAGIAIDPVVGKLYWASTDANVIRASNFDGTGGVDLISTSSPVALSLDVAGGFIYWTNPADRTIRRATLAGAGASTVFALGPDVGQRTPDGPGSTDTWAIWRRTGSPTPGALPYQVRLTGARPDYESAMIVKGNQKVVAVGDTIPGTAPNTVTIVGDAEAPIRISDRGDVLWTGNYYEPNIYDNFLYDALFWNGERLLRSGDIPAGANSQKLINFYRTAYSMDMSDSGEWALLSTNMQVPPYNFTPQPDNALLFQFTLPTACIADFNNSGAVTVQDIFDFLASYFTSAPAADVNGSGSVTVQDIFDFLAAYFAGCP